jgi:pimeloyl-ACP methyl ester carboxylesterase
MNPLFLDQPDGKIAYDDTGHGPLVVCIPSMGDLRSEYRFLAPQLTVAGYRVLSVDVRGHGETSTRWPDYSVEAIGNDLIALIRSLNSGPAFLIGTSMAAGASVCAAAEAPDLIAGLVLIDPFVRGETAWQNRLLFSVLFTRPWGPAIWLKYYASLYPSRKPLDFKKYCVALRANLQQPGRLEALQFMLTASKAASEAHLSRVSKSTLVLMGSRDPDFKAPEAEARFVASSLHGSYQMVEDAGHYPHAEMPEVTSPLVQSFLQSIK